MKRYVVRRLLMAIPLLLAISFVCFLFINLIPSNPAEVALRVQQMPVITDEAVAEMEEMLGLNKPFLIRYFDWVIGCLHGDFGISYVNPARTVAGELVRCLPATLQLAGASFVIVLVLSIPIGFLCAVYKDGWFDKIMRGVVFVTTAMPAYWVGLLLMWGVSVKLGLLPTNGNGTLAASYSAGVYRVAQLHFDLYPAHPQQYAGKHEAGLCSLCQCARPAAEIHSGQAYSEKFHAHLHRRHGHEYSAADCGHDRGENGGFPGGAGHAVASARSLTGIIRSFRLMCCSSACCSWYSTCCSMCCRLYPIPVCERRTDQWAPDFYTTRRR